MKKDDTAVYCGIVICVVNKFTLSAVVQQQAASAGDPWLPGGGGFLILF